MRRLWRGLLDVALAGSRGLAWAPVRGLPLAPVLFFIFLWVGGGLKRIRDLVEGAQPVTSIDFG